MVAERSFLFVPGDRPERFGKALSSGADRVIIDLEDAIAPDVKVVTRENLVRWLENADARDVFVRVNAVGTLWHEDDILALAPLSRVVGLMLPKAEDADAIAAARAKIRPDVRLFGLIETVKGLARLRAVAQAKGVNRLAFGSVDFCVETGIEGLGAELDFVRTQLTIESCFAGLPAPIEGVTIRHQVAGNAGSRYNSREKARFWRKALHSPRANRSRQSRLFAERGADRLGTPSHCCCAVRRRCSDGRWQVGRPARGSSSGKDSCFR